MKCVLTQFVPELNQDCIYFLDCLRSPVVCAQCKLKEDTFINIGVQRALQEQSRLVLNGAVKSDFYERLKACTTALTENVLPRDTHKHIQRVVAAVHNKSVGM